MASGLRLSRRLGAAVLFAVFALPAGAAGGGGGDTLEARMARLERAVAGQGLLDLANRVAELERDIRLMRGEIEKQAYLIEQQKGGRIEALGDIESRLAGLAEEQAALAAALAASAESVEAAPDADVATAPDAIDPAAGAVAAAVGAASAAPTGAEADAAAEQDTVLTVPMAAVLAQSAGAADAGDPVADSGSDAGFAPTADGNADRPDDPKPTASVATDDPAARAAQRPAATTAADPVAPDAPDQIALTGAVVNNVSTAPSEGASVKAEYQDAFDLLKSGDYPAAVVAFREFLLRNPQSEYADNAQYWLGESFYVTEDYPQAIAEYRTLIDVFPESQKFTHALLKIGYSQEAMGESAAARNTLEALARDYPNTTAARLAAERLRQLPAVPVEPEFVPAPTPVSTAPATPSQAATAP